MCALHAKEVCVQTGMFFEIASSMAGLSLCKAPAGTASTLDVQLHNNCCAWPAHHPACTGTPVKFSLDDTALLLVVLLLWLQSPMIALLLLLLLLQLEQDLISEIIRARTEARPAAPDHMTQGG
jgi:hypothetical protein